MDCAAARLDRAIGTRHTARNGPRSLAAHESPVTLDLCFPAQSSAWAAHGATSRIAPNPSSIPIQRVPRRSPGPAWICPKLITAVWAHGHPLWRCVTTARLLS
jgi:hypothetical protein